MTLSLDGLYKEISDWTREKFGRTEDPLLVIEQMRKELDLLEEEVNAYSKGWRRDREDMIMKASSLQISLWRLLIRFGVCSNSLSDHLFVKYMNNRKHKIPSITGEEEN